MSHRNPIDVDLDNGNDQQQQKSSSQAMYDQQQQQLFIRTPEGAVLYPSFYVGQHVVVEVSNAQFLHATVECVEIDKEKVLVYNNNMGDGNDEQQQQQEEEQYVFVYFVHFADQDRRLDAWVTGDKLRVSTNIGMIAANTGRNNKNSKASKSSTAVRTRSQLYSNNNNNNSNNNLLLTQNSSANSSRGQSISGTPTTTLNSGGGASSSFPSSTATTTKAGASSSTNNNNSGVEKHQPTTGKHYAAAARQGTADSKFFDRPKNVAKFVIGDVEVDAWYYSPYLLAHPKVREGIEKYNVFKTIPSDVNLLMGDSSTSTKTNNNNNTGNSNSNQQQQQQQSHHQSAAAASRHFTLHLCPYCFEPEFDHQSIVFHLLTCLRRPPGREVYRDPRNKLIVFECDGALHPYFAKNLALVSKAFLEHKSLDYDMTPFVFYVVCRYDDFVDGGVGVLAPSSKKKKNTTSSDDDDDDETDEEEIMRNSPGCRITSYFSREKQNSHNYNLSCILTLPQFQSLGYGRFMIDMSYEMGRREGKVGSPEKPLSDLGERMYRGVWKERVLDVLSSWSTQLENPVVVGANHPSKEHCPLLNVYDIMSPQFIQQAKLNDSKMPVASSVAQNGLKLSLGDLAAHSTSTTAVFSATFSGGSGMMTNNNSSSSSGGNASSSSILNTSSTSTTAAATTAVANASTLTAGQSSVNQAFSTLANAPYHSTQVHFSRTITLDALMQATGMIKDDVSKALQDLKCFDQRALLSSSNQQLKIKLNIDPEVLKKHFRTKVDRYRRGHAIFEPALFHWFPQWYAAGKGYNEAIRALNSGGVFTGFAARLPSSEDFKQAEEIVAKNNNNINDDDDDDENQSLGAMLAATSSSRKRTHLSSSAKTKPAAASTRKRATSNKNEDFAEKKTTTKSPKKKATATRTSSSSSSAKKNDATSAADKKKRSTSSDKKKSSTTAKQESGTRRQRGE